MKEIGSPEVDFTSFEGYLAALVLVEGLMHAGRTPTREGMIKAMESFRNVKMAGFAITFTPTSHEGSRFTDLSFIGSGRKFVH
jgi:ABC-type branched-subunit amino acid transport system substrate-binding protein